MKIRLHTSIVTDQTSYGFGEVVDLPATEANRLIARGSAVRAGEEIESAAIAAPENAARPGAKVRR